jgi:hypothetical protein
MEVGGLAVLDADQDGLSDIFVVPGPSEQPPGEQGAFTPILFLNTGSGFVPDSSLPQLSVCSESVLARDLDGDGRTDLLIGGTYFPKTYPDAAATTLLLRDEGTFRTVEIPPLPPGQAVKDMQVLDIDGDGDLDILLTGHWGGVHLLRREKDRYVLEELDLPAGWWNCMEVADIDGDGDDDLILGNEGLNSIFQASADEPVRLIAKDFNRDGRMDPIWSLYLKGREVAVHPLGTLTDQVVQYKKRFTRFSEYAAAELGDLFTSGDLKGALHLEATELRSGIALNNGTGRFTFQPLPLAAQRSPVNDLLVRDFNGDGHPDLLLIGNFYANEPIFGQHDASFGTLMLGQPDGTFEECPMPQSGLKLDGDARNLLFLEQEQLILVTQNQGAVRSFQLQTADPL